MNKAKKSWLSFLEHLSAQQVGDCLAQGTFGDRNDAREQLQGDVPAYHRGRRDQLDRVRRQVLESSGDQLSNGAGQREPFVVFRARLPFAPLGDLPTAIFITPEKPAVHGRPEVLG